MKIASWNVNSLNVRLSHVLEWLDAHQPDLLGLQELKMTDDKFPIAAFESIGYGAIFSGQKTYNGVAILHRKKVLPEPTSVQINLPNFPDEQKRLISASYGDFLFVCAYVVNGHEVGSEKYAYKLAWLQALVQTMQNWLVKHPKLALVGDFNIAPEDHDVYDPLAWGESILCSPQERAYFKELLSLGLFDAFREKNKDLNQYTWWDYRQLGFQKNRGLRIDHILLSNPLKNQLSDCEIDKTPRKKPQPSDHAPIWATI